MKDIIRNSKYKLQGIYYLYLFITIETQTNKKSIDQNVCPFINKQQFLMTNNFKKRFKKANLHLWK